MATKPKRNPENSINTQKPCGRLEVHGNYAGLARAAWVIADERNRELDEIEHLLDAGKDQIAIAAMRRYIRPNGKPVQAETRRQPERKESA